MIAKIDTTGINLELNDDIKKYITSKIGRLDKYLPRGVRQGVRATVTLRETGNRLGNKYECEAIIKLPGASLQAKEATLNMFAAVDIVEAKLKNQLSKYKAEYLAQHPTFLRRLVRRSS